MSFRNYLNRLRGWMRTDFRTPRRASSRLVLEPLEDRTLPSSIVWTNRGAGASDTDSFNAVFGGKAETARAVVRSALDAWQHVIQNFNYADGSNTLSVEISMDTSTLNTGAFASWASEKDTNGKPMAAEITLGSGADGLGAGWYLDPVPNDSAEFRGSIVNAFAGDATPGSAAVDLSDLFTVVVLEMTHVVGLNTDPDEAFQRDASGYLASTGASDSVFTDGSGNPVGTLFTFTGPSVRALFTSNNGGSGDGASDTGRAAHTAEPGNSFTNPFTGLTYSGAQDSGNAQFEFGRRYLPSLLDALVLKDAYGYTINLPQAFGTFYANLDRTTGNLLVRGGMGDTGISEDIITVNTAGTSAETLQVSVDIGADVPGTGPTGPLVSSFNILSGEVQSITVQAGDGSDQINLEHTLAGVSVTVQGEGEADTVNVSPVAKNLDNIQGTLIVNGGDGADTLNINDQSNPFGTSYTITSTAVTRSGAAAIYYRPKLPFGTSAMEAVYVNAGSGSDTISIQGTPSGTLVAVNGGSGNDAFNIGSSTNTLDALLGDLVLNGESGTDALTIRDQGTTIGKTYSLAYHWWGTLTRTGAGVINHALMESLAVNAGTGADTSNVHSTAAGTPVTVNGGGGNDIFNVGNPADSLDSILGTLTVNGQAGDDALNINDQGTATAKSYTVNPYSVTRSGAAAIKFQADFIVIGAPAWVETVVLNAGNGDDLIRVQGTVPGTSVTANAGGGTDKLDYSSYSSGVTVNLATGSATGLAAISGVENVTGGSGGDTLIGDAGSNILVGGNGRDLLIGGAGADTLAGGTGDDILIGGLYDALPDALTLIAAEWTRTDQTYQQRIDHLRSGGPGAWNGSARLNSTTVADDGAADVLSGGGGLDWFWGNAAEVTDLAPGEVIN